MTSRSRSRRATRSRWRVLRTGAHPARGGTLCLAGDCGNCLAQVDGIAYVRTCQTPAVPGLVVRRHPPVDMPPLPVVAASSVTSSPAGREIEVRRVEVDVAIVGGGASGQAARAEAERAGRTVLVLDAAAGDEVVAIYAGGMLVVRTRSGMLHVTAQEIVVATGAAELHPVCPGNQLEGLFTARAAERLRRRGRRSRPRRDRRGRRRGPRRAVHGQRAPRPAGPLRGRRPRQRRRHRGRRRRRDDDPLRRPSWSTSARPRATSSPG